MKIIRTDGGGENFSDERLKHCRNILNHLGISDFIYELHDHKGTLNVYWKKAPNDFEIQVLNNLWNVLLEYCINHYVTYSKLYKEFT